ncbi:MAG: AAA family ATPase [Rickettsiales bacterium]|jgi:DNA replication and repair protein RecF|nr:AAA family ATPase [Rickettsiales bacterium]
MLEQITLTNFRNHKTLRLNTKKKNIVLFGPNGAGKTNVLEAVSLLNGGSGLRRAQSADLALFGSDEYAIAAAVVGGAELSVYWRAGMGHRKAKINGENAPLWGLSEHIGIVWLTPADDLLFVGPPSGRRVFLDNLAAGFDGAHAGRIARLSRLLSERAFALKNNRDDEWLDLIEANIASAAAAVADARVRFAGEANHFFEGGEIALCGMLENKIINGEKAGDFEDFYRRYLAENRFLVADKMTIDGAHRFDFSVMNQAVGLSADKTSSGQQKLLLNKLVIANAKLIKAKTPDRPLLILLDEADSHLDENAREKLFDELSGTSAQIWLTGTDLGKFSNIPESINLELKMKN